MTNLDNENGLFQKMKKKTYKTDRRKKTGRNTENGDRERSRERLKKKSSERERETEKHEKSKTNKINPQKTTKIEIMEQKTIQKEAAHTL